MTYVNEGTAINSPFRGCPRCVQSSVVVFGFRETTDPSRSGTGADLGCSGLGRCSVVVVVVFGFPKRRRKEGEKGKRGGERRGN